MGKKNDLDRVYNLGMFNNLCNMEAQVKDDNTNICSICLKKIKPKNCFYMSSAQYGGWYCEECMKKCYNTSDKEYYIEYIDSETIKLTEKKNDRNNRKIL